MSEAERKHRLWLAVTEEVRAGGHVESQSDFGAVVAYGEETNHLLHVVLTLLTCGLWLFVWAMHGIFGGTRKSMVAVDQSGQVTVTALDGAFRAI